MSFIILILAVSFVCANCDHVMNTNSDGSVNIMGKLPIAGNDRNILSTVGGLEGVGVGFEAGFAGVTLDNANGHSLSLTTRHIPRIGDQLTGAGNINLFHNDNHDVSVNAFATKTFPSNPAIPNFNTVGCGVDYMYNNKVGASIGVQHMDLLKKTDYSAMGKVNLFRDPTSSLDFSAGATKSSSPFLPSNSWHPSAKLTFSKYF